ncbi:MAG: 50S ribosomal protein L30 [Desulfurococcaceae archaeon]
MLYAIIRIRGTVNVPYEVEHTLNLLRLRRKYTLVLYRKDAPGLEDMLRKASGWITWGEINDEVLAKLLEKRGRLPGNKRLTEDVVRQWGFQGGFAELAKRLISGEVDMRSLPMKPFMRLHPPRGGFRRSTRRLYSDGGELGYRGQAINELILRMI